MWSELYRKKIMVDIFERFETYERFPIWCTRWAANLFVETKSPSSSVLLVAPLISLGCLMISLCLPTITRFDLDLLYRNMTLPRIVILPVGQASLWTDPQTVAIRQVTVFLCRLLCTVYWFRFRPTFPVLVQICKRSYHSLVYPGHWWTIDNVVERVTIILLFRYWLVPPSWLLRYR